jgi:hypothetical protein
MQCHFLSLNPSSTQPVLQYLRLQYSGLQDLHDYALLVSLGMERSNEMISDSLSPTTVTVSGGLSEQLWLWKHTCFSLVPVHYLLLISHGQEVKQKNNPPLVARTFHHLLSALA